MNSRYRHGFLFTFALFVSLATGDGVRAEVLNIVQTGITGAQSNLNVAFSYAWNFTVTSPLTFDSVTAKFQLKRGSSTTAPAVMTLWQTGSSFDIATGTSIGSYSLSPGSATQSFVSYDFLVDTTSIALHGYYALSLTSTAATPSSQQWFIKGAKSGLQFVDGSGNTVSGITDNGEVVPVVPEPSSTALLAGFAATAAVVTGWRQRRRLSPAPLR